MFFLIRMKASSEYPSDPNTIYAFNRPAYSCTQYLDSFDSGSYFADIGKRTSVMFDVRGSLTIRKVTDGGTTPADTTFTITGPNDYLQTVRYGDFVDGSYTIADLIPGDYTVTENESTANIPTRTLTVDGNGIVASLARYDELDKEVTITNTYTNEIIMPTSGRRRGIIIEWLSMLELALFVVLMARLLREHNAKRVTNSTGTGGNET